MSDNDRNAVPVGGVFTIRMAVRWGDMDAVGHVNNTLYFQYFEEARVVMLERVGLGFGVERGWVLAHASCDFLKPLLYPARIDVSLRLLRVGRSSVEFDVWVALADEPDSVYARGRNVMVFIDNETGRSVALPPNAVQRLSTIFLVPSARV
ncbi:acyl-CoA thioesterase [Alcaligenaceae bacterium CGII-47]|nr:acyl-CoA thioesterase [Alcaligenaceae bacterium CGII-47]